MKMDENLAKAVERVDFCVDRQKPVNWADWRAIRARLVELEAENERLRADRDSWCDQASQRVADWDCMRKRAEKAEATIREIRDATHKSALMLRSMADRHLSAHLSENGNG